MKEESGEGLVVKKVQEKDASSVATPSLQGYNKYEEFDVQWELSLD